MDDNAMIVRSRRVVLPDGIRGASVEIQGGRIAAVHAWDRLFSADVMDAGDLMVLPGVVDTHVHINDPGRAGWEGFEHATRAAAAGGVTTLVDMPLNSVPPTTTVAGLDAKVHAAHTRCHVDVAFWGGVVPGNAADLEPLARAGVPGFKCFLSPSGVDEFQHVTERDLREAVPIVARLGLPLLVHAELPSHLREPDPHQDPRSHATWLASRPPAAEHAAIALLIRLAREYGARIHVVHLASGGGLTAIREARDAGVFVTAETCPHYLTFAAEEVADGATSFKCAPPIRSRADREQLWRAVEDGRLDLIASDHSPSPPTMKHLDDGDFLRAWGGIASLQLALSAVWTGASSRGIAVERIVECMCAAPARLAGLQGRKGAIAPGLDADLLVWDPDAEFVVDPLALQHRHPVTPYAGMRLRGVVRTTVVRGEVVYDRGAFADVPRGRHLLR